MDNTINNTEALNYLVKYGYQRDKQIGSFINQDGGFVGYMKKALLDFQSFAGIRQTGVLDKETAKMMKMPRCGVRDQIGHGAQSNKSNRLYHIYLMYFTMSGIIVVGALIGIYHQLDYFKFLAILPHSAPSWIFN